MKTTFIASTTLFVLLLSACSRPEEPAYQPTIEEPTPVAAAIQQVVGQARIEPEGKVANLSAAVNGIIQSVLKQENETVQKGEVIVVLEHDIEQAKLAQRQSRIHIQAAKIKAYASELDEISVRVANKQKEYNRIAALFGKGAETQQRLDDTETEWNVLKASYEKAKANLSMAKAEQVEIMREKDLAQAELNQRFIKSPANGQLISMNAVPGNSVEPQVGLAEFAPAGKLIARAEVDELFADKIKVGQLALIRPVGAEENITTGIVIYAASALKRKSLFSEKAGDQEDRRVREVKIQLDDPKSLLINARVECVIKVSE